MKKIFPTYSEYVLNEKKELTDAQLEKLKDKWTRWIDTFTSFRRKILGLLN
jgi:hypothetical protein